MGLSPEQIKKLNAKLDPNAVRQRKGGGGMQLDYVEGWYAIDQANQILGHDGWSRNTRLVERVAEPKHYTTTTRDGVVKDMFKVAVWAQVDITAAGVTRTGTGYGSSNGPCELEAFEGAVKEAETDATKRALMTFGYPFGLALYDKDRKHVGDPNEVSEEDAPTGQEIVLALQEAKGSDETADGTPAWKESLDAVLATFSERDGVEYKKPDDLPPNRRVQWMTKLREQGASK